MLLVYWRVGSLTSEYRVLMILTVLGSVPIYSVMQVYHKRHGLLVGLGRLLAGWLILLAVLIGHCLHHPDQCDLFAPGHHRLGGAGLRGPGGEFSAPALPRPTASRKVCNERRSVIIGTCPTAHELAKKLSRPNRALVLGFIATAD